MISKVNECLRVTPNQSRLALIHKILFVYHAFFKKDFGLASTNLYRQ